MEWRGILGEKPVFADFPSVRGLTPPGRARTLAADVRVSAIASTNPQSTAPAHSGGSPANTRDQYRSPQICPVLPAYTLNRTANVCFIHC
ncbi:MAG: hypothetical protein LBC53_02120, partial [Spirochaetaceae bacterium]|nr:hypothetical protein [Spirochaetaceae bacterium]